MQSATVVEINCNMEFYDITEKLGQGSFGTAYICKKLHNKQSLVLKKIPTNLFGKDLAVALNEVAILRSLDHPNIIAYCDSYLKDCSICIVMEYASHGNLHQYIAKNKIANTFLQPQIVIDFFCQILYGLNHIHKKGIVHRDLKCENIFLTGKNFDVLKIGDFGISKLITSNYCANTVIGTCNYVAPEICDGKPYNFKTDIWSLGCILYELCELEKMFEGTVSNVILAIINAKLKPINIRRYGAQLQELLNSLLKSDPNERPDTKTIMTLGDVFPSLHCLSVNLGCIF